jgi:peroxiredoxin
MIKRYFKPFITGIVVTLVLILVMLKITMNFQVLLFLGAIIFFIAGYINSSSTLNRLITAVPILIFYSGFFIFIVLEELPVLWYFVPIYITSTLLGLYYRAHKGIMIASSLVLILLMFFLSIRSIPNDLESVLTKERFDRLPEFSIQGVNGEVTSSSSLRGKVVVLDFFGTWCKPCILELKELAKVKDFFEGEEVVFYVINADQGGDTPAKFDAFINEHDYDFNFAYDHGSKIFKQLEMAHLGLPTLLIIDKDQNIRLQHVGYNAAETNFRNQMIEMINSLK